MSAALRVRKLTKPPEGMKRFMVEKVNGVVDDGTRATILRAASPSPARRHLEKHGERVPDQNTLKYTCYV